MPGKFCKDTKSETFWPPEMARRARGRLNKKKARTGEKWKRKAEGRKKKKNIEELFGSWVEMQLSYSFTWTIKPPDHPKFFAYLITNELYSALFHLSVACGLQTYFGLSLLSLRKFRGREATTGNRLISLQTWKFQIDIAKYSDAKDTGKGFIKTK